MRIQYDDRPCGSGKTYGELQHMVSTKGRYLLAVDQKRAMRDRDAEIHELARRAGKRVSTVLIESGERNGEWRSGLTTIRTSTSVRATVAAVPVVHDIAHVIVIITHEALKLADLAEFSGWHLVIDETPSILDQQALQTTLSRDFFERHYRLRPSGKRSEVVARGRATAADMRRDSLTAPLTVMHSRVLSPRTRVLTDIADWDDLGAAGAWTWASIWSPEQLAIFHSVLILANAFTRSLTYAVLSRLWPGIEWVPHRRLALRTYRTRRMTIRYFAAGHTAYRSLFASEEGKRRLGLVAAWIAQRTKPETHIWTCNDVDAPSIGRHIQKPLRLSPRQAGSNSYEAATTVTAIYTAKPAPAERALFEDLGIDPHRATETREFETIFQFVCRCAVRDPASEADLTVHVYDRQQAEYLEELFASTGYVRPVLELVDLGFGSTPPPAPSKPGPKPKVKTPAQKAADDERRREQDRKRKQKQRA